MIRFVDGTVDPILEFLVGWSIRWGVLIVALALWLRLRPPRRAATRHLLCATALLAGLALPLAPRWAVPWRSSPAPGHRSSIEVPISEVDRLAVPPPISESVEPSPAPIPSTARVEAPRPVAPARVERSRIERVEAESMGTWRWVRFGIGSAWLAVSVLFLTRLVIGRAILARLRSSAKPLSGAVFGQCQAELRCRRGSILASHPAVASPVVLGGLAPMILVPSDWDGWPEANQRACLLHELAHLNRHDDRIKFIAELARGPFWFHPAVGWLLARLDSEAELACDETAVGLGVAPLDLAGLLLSFTREPRRLDLSRLAIGRQALSFFERGTVSTRITRLLEDDMPRSITSASKSKTLSLVATVALLGLAIGGASVRAIEPTPLQQQQPAEAKPARSTPISSFLVVVKDEQGRPIEGAIVVAGIIENGTGRDVTQARTGLDGTARFEREPRPNVWVVAYKEGHSFTSAQLFDASGSTPTSLILPMPKALSGTVEDSEGHPIAGAEVRAQAAQNVSKRMRYFFPALESLVRGTPIERALVALTDRQGNFRFDSLPADAGITLRTSAEGKATILTPRGTDAAGAGLPSQIVLAPEARVTGRVVSSLPGVGVAGRSVTVFGIVERRSPIVSGKVTTDAEGRFEVRGLAEGRANVVLDDVPADGPWTFLAATDILLAPGATAEAKIEIVEGVRVTGSVTSTDGKPIAGVTILGSGARNPQPGSRAVIVATDAAGIYRLRMPAGNLSVALDIQVAGYTSPSDSDLRKSAVLAANITDFTVPPFVLTPGVKLTGRVVDATGKPLEGARLTTLGIQPLQFLSNPVSTTSDPNGHFSLEALGDGRPIPLNESVSLQIRLADGQEFDASAVAKSEGEVTIKLPTLRDGGPKGPQDVAADEMAGLVVDTQGRPIEGVLAHPMSWVPNFKTLTDKNGLFRIKLPEQDKYEIRFSKEGYEPREFLARSTGQTGWVVVMGDRTYFEGLVLAQDGSPVADAPIRADSGPKRLSGGRMGECWTEGRSGKDGRYRLYVEPGMYEFQIRAPGSGVVRLPKQAIATDEGRTLDLRLQPGVDFVARVVDAQDGKPIAGFVLKDWRNPSVAGTSDAEGILRIPSMMPGKFSFRTVQAEGYARWWSDACLTEFTRFQKSNRNGFQRNFDGLDFDMKPGMPAVTIIAEKAATIRGRVLDPDGKGVAGATVAPALTGSGNSLTGDTRFSVETDQDGNFTMKAPASGEIAYNLVAHDGKIHQWRTWANGVVEPFRTTPGLVMDDVILRLTRPSTVRGRVLDAAGQPVAGREVRASSADKRENRYYDPTTRTKADGTFELRFISAGDQSIQVEPFWLDAQQAPPGTSRTLTLVEGETREGVELTAAPARAGR